MTLYSSITKKVKASGTPGVDCDYTDIKAALDSINDNSEEKRYTVYVLDGVYNISNDGFNYLGFKNYVNIVGQSRKGVQVIKRQAEYSDVYAAFDPEECTDTIEYCMIKNLTIRTYNCKCPVHIDGRKLNGTIEIIDCDLINENTPGMGNYQNGLACGLRENQHVVCKGVYTNGFLWAHNSNEIFAPLSGCSFELYNCIMKYTMVGDLISYANDRFVMKGCKLDYLKFIYIKDYPFANYPTMREYILPSFNFELQGNSINYITDEFSDGSGGVFENEAMNALYGGKWCITEGSIHNYCRNASSENISKTCW